MAAAVSDAGNSAEDRPPSHSPEVQPTEAGEGGAEEHDRKSVSQDEQASRRRRSDGGQEEGNPEASPLPYEDAPPPLPNEPLPGQEDDGWDALWDDNSQAYYFFNRFTGISQWENPRVPGWNQEVANGDSGQNPRSRAAGGYDPAVHGDYDPTAWYAQPYQEGDNAVSTSSADPNMIYTATGTFNRFTGKWQPAGLGPEQFSNENKSRRQMNAYFDVDAAANSHDGKSLKAERSGKKLTKKELKAFREKRRERKEEKRKAWLRD